VTLLQHMLVCVLLKCVNGLRFVLIRSFITNHEVNLLPKVLTIHFKYLTCVYTGTQ